MTTTKDQLIQEIEEVSENLLQEVLCFLRVAKLSQTLTNNENQIKPIWEIAKEISEKIPDEEWEKLPKDLSKNLDYYLYDSSELKS